MATRDISEGENTELPMVSVVIPAYNEGSHIERGLRSVTDYLATIEDRYRWEVVVIDDGSTDDTLAVVGPSHPTHYSAVATHSRPNRKREGATHDGQTCRHPLRHCDSASAAGRRQERLPPA